MKKEILTTVEKDVMFILNLLNPDLNLLNFDIPVRFCTVRVVKNLLKD